MHRTFSIGREGFTLIELLVVIAIIGILAVAVLSAINPLEQINKARDTGKKADATELQKAIERYYTNSNPPMYPWNTDTNGFSAASNDPGDAYVFNSKVGSPNWSWLSNMSATQELKDTFVTRMRNSKEFKVIRGSGANLTTYICYYPVSNSERKNADAYCQTNGDLVNRISPDICATTTGVAPSVAGTNAICVP